MLIGHDFHRRLTGLYLRVASLGGPLPRESGRANKTLVDRPIPLEGRGGGGESKLKV